MPPVSKDNLLEWKSDFELGIPEIDKEHERLFKIMNKMHTLLQEPQKQEFACVEGLKYLRSYTLQHFVHEEEYMRSIGYEGYEMHKQIHRAFTHITLPAMERHLEKENYSPESIERFVGICLGWLIAHTHFEDGAIVGKVSSKWDDDHDPDVNVFLKKSLVRVMQELANIELRPVSLHYSGERIGQSIAYQVVYDDGAQNYWQVTVALEWGLILKMVSVLFGVTVEQLDDVALTAFKELTQMFIHRMGVFKKSENHFTVHQDRILTQIELKDYFEKDRPRYSLLFGSDYGLMIFSTDVWRGGQAEE